MAEKDLTPAPAKPEPKASRVVKTGRGARHDSTPPPDIDIHRTLPHSLEAEQGVLGSMLISPTDVIGAFVEFGIAAEWFYQPAHALLYKLLVDQWEKGYPADVITLTQILRDRNELDQVGGPSFITHLFTFTPTAANADYYAQIVKEKYRLREIISAGTTMASRAYEEQGDVAGLLDTSEAAVLAIRTRTERTRPDQTIKEHVMTAIEDLEALFQKDDAMIGLSTGLKGLDRMTSGLRPADMIVIAARPSMGKTALCLNIAEHVAVTLKRGAAVFSLEMSTGQLVQRMLCSRAKVSVENIRDKKIGEYDFARLTKAAGEIAESPLYIDDTAGISILELRAKARRLKQQHGIEIIVIDYLQLLKGTSRRADESRQNEVAEISSGIKALAKELNIPIVVAAQLNRNPEGRATGKPRLSDLRESGAIEQDADVVGLLVRSEYYADDDEEKEEVKGEAELNIAKQRNGPVGDVYLTFLKEFTRFADRASGFEPPGG